MSKNILFFLSYEAYAHVIRQRAVIEELLKFKKDLKITIITNTRLRELKKFFLNRVKYLNLHNLIETKKDKGTLDLKGTKKIFQNWYKKEELWTKTIVKKFKKVDLIISDSVPQAFKLKKFYKCLAVNISHFSWDWYYSIHYKKDDKILKKLKKYYGFVDKFFNLPYSPPSLSIKKSKKKYINFITYGNFKSKKLNHSKINCLIMDNGTKSLSSSIENILPKIMINKKINFFIGTDSLSKKSKKIIIKSSNMTSISGLKNMHSYISSVDFIIARGGYNTLTECLILKKPSLLMYETNNKEIFYNISQLKRNNF